MPRYCLIGCFFCAVLLSSERSSRAQARSSEWLSPKMQLRIDAAFEEISNPTSKSNEDLLKPIINELNMQFHFVTEKRKRFLETHYKTLEELEKLRAAELEQSTESVVPATSKETIEMLLRNSLVELQRLNWLAAAEVDPSKSMVLDLNRNILESRFSQVEAEILEVEKIFLRESTIVNQIEELNRKGVANPDEVLRAKNTLSNVQRDLDKVKQRKEELRQQIVIEEVTEIEKTALNSKKLQQQRKVVENDIRDLRRGLQELTSTTKNRLAIEACEDRIRSLDREINRLVIQEAEINMLIDFLKGHSIGK
jgi:hypothetical protein